MNANRTGFNLFLFESARLLWGLLQWGIGLLMYVFNILPQSHSYLDQIPLMDVFMHNIAVVWLCETTRCI